MSTPTRKPYLSDEDLIGYITTNGVTLYSQHRMSPVDVRDKYEAHLAEQEQTIADLTARVEAMQKARNPSLSVDKIMEVYHEHERWFNLHGGTPAKRSGNFKARLNKLIG